MLQKFYPKESYPSAYEVDYNALYRRGFRGLLFDIDNTLVGHDADADDRSVKMIHRLQKTGFSICLLSNNDEKRVKRFTSRIPIPYIYKAGKPSVRSYLAGAERMNCTKETVAFIGDQIFTDIYGANRAGIYSILVKPLAKKEEIQIVLKRYLEKIVLFFYQRSRRIS